MQVCTRRAQRPPWFCKHQGTDTHPHSRSFVGPRLHDAHWRESGEGFESAGSVTRPIPRKVHLLVVVSSTPWSAQMADEHGLTGNVPSNNGVWLGV